MGRLLQTLENAAKALDTITTNTSERTTSTITDEDRYVTLRQRVQSTEGHLRRARDRITKLRTENYHSSTTRSSKMTMDVTKAQAGIAQSVGYVKHLKKTAEMALNRDA